MTEATQTIVERLPTEAVIRAAVKETEYKYFGDYEMSEGQRDAVETLVCASLIAITAKTEIERLQARVKELEEKLQPFAKISGIAVSKLAIPPEQDRLWSYYNSRDDIQYEITRQHVDDAARAVLQSSGK